MVELVPELPARVTVAPTIGTVADWPFTPLMVTVTTEESVPSATAVADEADTVDRDADGVVAAAARLPSPGPAPSSLADGATPKGCEKMCGAVKLFSRRTFPPRTRWPGCRRR